MRVRSVIVQKMWISRSFGPVDAAQKAEKLLMPMAGQTLGNHVSVGEIQGREQRRRPVPFCNRGSAVPAGRATRATSVACDRAAWICLFSSTHKTSAFAGGFRYSPTTSRSLSTNWGSRLNLKAPPDAVAACEFSRCGKRSRLRPGHRPWTVCSNASRPSVWSTALLSRSGPSFRADALLPSAPRSILESAR